MLSASGFAADAFASEPALGSGQLWGIRKTQAGSAVEADAVAWDYTTGSTAVTVAGIDSGVDYTHPDLYKNIWINQGEVPTGLTVVEDPADGDTRVTFSDLNVRSGDGWANPVSDRNGNSYIDGYDLLNDPAWEDGADGDANGYADDLLGWDFVANDNDPMDDNGHGTHTAGTFGASANDGGVVGVAWTVQIMPLKFLAADGSGSGAGGAAAIRYAANNGARVSNNSWGGGYDAGINQAVAYANGKGHLVVASAGNSGVNNDSSIFRSYPASLSHSNIISVAATDSNDGKPQWSNYGKTTVDLAAPGVGIVSTLPKALDTSDGVSDGYASYNGTSMAAPHVAGAAALLFAARPGISAADVKSLILNNVDRVKSMQRRAVSEGRLNVLKAVRASGALQTASAGTAGTGSQTGTSPSGSTFSSVTIALVGGDAVSAARDLAADAPAAPALADLLA